MVPLGRIDLALKGLLWRACFTAVLLLGGAAAAQADTFPRLLGMNIGEKHYHDPAYQRDLARMDIVVLGFYRGWGGGPEAMRRVVQNLKALNPDIRVGQYSVLNELRDVANDVATADTRWKVSNAGWWLRNAAGERVQWTSKYHAWEVNFTAWARPDDFGQRYPQWLAERDYRVYHQPVPEFDFWYTDNIKHRPRVHADWDGDGVNDRPDDPRILTAWREGYGAWWARMRALTPGRFIMGNADRDLDEPEFRQQLEAAFLEGLMGRPWSIETRLGWTAMMAHYRAVKANLREPRIVGFNVAGNPRDYRFFRYAYASSLMDDGHFSFTDAARGYSSVPWFDEYDIALGRAISPPPTAPWRNGVWRRDFERGVALVNPGAQVRSVALEPGLARFAGRQDAATNDGRAAARVLLAPRDGLILVRAVPGGTPHR